MKQINSIFRTLCLAALLCMSSVSAMAYQILPSNTSMIEEDYHWDWGDNNVLVLDGGTYELQIIWIGGYKPLALVITEGTTVSVSEYFYNEAFCTVYVFGTLNINESCAPANDGTIYVMEGGSLNREIEDNLGDIIYGCKMSDILASHEVDGKKPTLNEMKIEDGWKDFYVKDAIFCENDYYPIPGTTAYYTDATMTTPISDLEAWKQGEGKIKYSIAPYKTEAINEINEARKEIVYIWRYDNEVESYIGQINAVIADENDIYAIEFALNKIDELKGQAFEIIQQWKLYVESIKFVIEARDAAIKEIYEAMSDVLVYYPDCEKEVEEYISTIQGAENIIDVDWPKAGALAKIEKIREIANSAYKYYMGTFITKQAGPAIEIEGEDGKTIKLYKIKKVKFGKEDE